MFSCDNIPPPRSNAARHCTHIRCLLLDHTKVHPQKPCHLHTAFVIHAQLLHTCAHNTGRQYCTVIGREGPSLSQRRMGRIGTRCYYTPVLQVASAILESLGKGEALAASVSGCWTTRNAAACDIMRHNNTVTWFRPEPLSLHKKPNIAHGVIVKVCVAQALKPATLPRCLRTCCHLPTCLSVLSPAPR
jgi:hypothetical protein